MFHRPVKSHIFRVHILGVLTVSLNVLSCAEDWSPVDLDETRMFVLQSLVGQKMKLRCVEHSRKRKHNSTVTELIGVKFC